MTTYTWPDLTTALLRGDNLSADATSWAMDTVMNGDAGPVALAGFLVALRAKGETAAEVAGLVDAMLAHSVPVTVPTNRGLAVDTCGTGGDRAHTVNISTMAAVVVAATGATVVKHGGRAGSSAAGSADVLEALGVVIDLSPRGVQECIEQVGIAFCFAPAFHPGMRHAAVVRRELGFGTVFNVLGPLANPSRPAAQMVGCYDEALAPVMAGALLARGTRALVVRGQDGLDELSTYAPSRVWDVTGSDLQEVILDPIELGIKAPAAGALRGADAAFNAEVAVAMIGGDRSARIDPVRDAVLLNAAAALVAHDAASAPSSDIGLSIGDRIAAVLPRVLDAVDSGAAGLLLSNWISLGQRLVGS